MGAPDKDELNTDALKLTISTVRAHPSDFRSPDFTVPGPAARWLRDPLIQEWLRAGSYRKRHEKPAELIDAAWMFLEDVQEQLRAALAMHLESGKYKESITVRDRLVTALFAVASDIDLCQGESVALSQLALCAVIPVVAGGRRPAEASVRKAVSELEELGVITVTRGTRGKSNVHHLLPVHVKSALRSRSGSGSTSSSSSPSAPSTPGSATPPAVLKPMSACGLKHPLVRVLIEEQKEEYWGVLAELAAQRRKREQDAEAERLTRMETGEAAQEEAALLAELEAQRQRAAQREADLSRRIAILRARPAGVVTTERQERFEVVGEFADAGAEFGHLLEVAAT